MHLLTVFSGLTCQALLMASALGPSNLHLGDLQAREAGPSQHNLEIRGNQNDGSSDKEEVVEVVVRTVKKKNEQLVIPSCNILSCTPINSVKRPEQASVSTSSRGWRRYEYHGNRPRADSHANVILNKYLNANDKGYVYARTRSNNQQQPRLEKVQIEDRGFASTSLKARKELNEQMHVYQVFSPRSLFETVEEMVATYQPVQQGKHVGYTLDNLRMLQRMLNDFNSPGLRQEFMDGPGLFMTDTRLGFIRDTFLSTMTRATSSTSAKAQVESISRIDWSIMLREEAQALLDLLNDLNSLVKGRATKITEDVRSQSKTLPITDEAIFDFPEGSNKANYKMPISDESTNPKSTPYASIPGAIVDSLCSILQNTIKALTAALSNPTTNFKQEEKSMESLLDPTTGQTVLWK